MKFNTLFPCTVGFAKKAGIGAPGPAFFVPEERAMNHSLHYWRQDSSTLKIATALRG